MYYILILTVTEIVFSPPVVQQNIASALVQHPHQSTVQPHYATTVQTQHPSIASGTDSACILTLRIFCIFVSQ
jgi:hypothetical protein